MRPSEIIHLEREAFGSEFCCLGRQLVEVLRVVQASHSDVNWYVADVHAVGPPLTPRVEPMPRLIGDTEALVRSAQKVEQFESGVFAGVPRSKGEPTFREGGLWTEDEDDADLGDAVVEVRAFDTSYWIVATVDAELARELLGRFGPEGVRVPKAAEDIQDMEYDWLGCDEAGFVALFSTAGAGHAPAGFLRDTYAHDRAIQELLAAPALDPCQGCSSSCTWSDQHVEARRRAWIVRL